MNLKNLIDFFPYQYKERDTYKVNGEGILERFLRVCGTYLEDVVTPDIDNTVKLIDINHVPTIYLNYLWEFLGQIPLACMPNIDKAKFEKYFNGLKSVEELEALSKVWTYSKSGPLILGENRVRALLKYAITLFKVRGTKLFFETLFNFYGLTCTITDPIQGNDDSFSNFHWLVRAPEYDSYGDSYDTGLNHDVVYGCQQCFTITADISNIIGFRDINGVWFRGSEELILSGKYDQVVDLYEGITEYNNTEVVYTDNQDDYVDANEALIFTNNLPLSLDDFRAFRRLVYFIFERYLPYNVAARIKFQGLDIDDQPEIEVEQLQSDLDVSGGIPNTILSGGILPKLHYRVKVKSKWELADLRWQVNSNYTNIHQNGDILEISVPGTYHIYTKVGIGHTITVSEKMLNKWYSLEYTVINYKGQDSTSSLTYDSDTISMNIYVRAIRYYQEYDEDLDDIITRSEVVATRLIKGKQASDSVTPGPAPQAGYTQYVFSDEYNLHGEQTVIFQIDEYPIKTLTLNIKAMAERATGSCNPNPVVYNSGSTPTTVVHYSTTYGGEDDELLCIKCNELPDVEAQDGDTVTFPNEGTYNFYLAVNPSLTDESLIERAKSIDLSNSALYPTRWSVNVSMNRPLRVDVQASQTKILTLKANYLKVRVNVTGGSNIPSTSYNIKVYKNGVDTGTILTGANLWVHPFGTNGMVATDGLYKFESVLDPTKYTTVELYTQQDSPVSRIGLFIKPDNPDDVNWDTDWSTNDMVTIAKATAFPVTIILKLYLKNTPIAINESILIQDANWNVIDEVSIDTPIVITSSMYGSGPLHFVHNSSFSEALLLKVIP